MNQFEKTKLLLGLEIDDTGKDSLIELLLEQARDEFLQYTNRDEVPETANNVIIEMAVVKYNLLGTEGLQSQSYSGASEEYANYSPQLIKALNRYRKVKML